VPAKYSRSSAKFATSSAVGCGGAFLIVNEEGLEFDAQEALAVSEDGADVGLDVLVEGP
jgi:hypothetical protein